MSAEIGCSESDLEALAKMAEQNALKVNQEAKTRHVRGKFGWGISPNIERSSIRREAKTVVVKPKRQKMESVCGNTLRSGTDEEPRDERPTTQAIQDPPSDAKLRLSS